MSDSSRPHGLQNARLPCPSRSPRSWLKLKFIESMMPSNHLILCCPLLLLPSIFPNIRVFYWWYWMASGGIGASVHSGLISFRTDWFDLFLVQGTLKNLLQHHHSKASILLCSDFFIGQLSRPYTITRKTIALTRYTFVGKVMSLLLIDTYHYAFVKTYRMCNKNEPKCKI